MFISDSCHTLICAMMLLNIDHHSQVILAYHPTYFFQTILIEVFIANVQNIARKMTLEEFMDNLSALNDGEDFPEHLLKDVYQSVCNEPFKCPLLEL